MRTLVSAALIAAMAPAMLAAPTAAIAQSGRADQARWDAAQARYRAETDRYYAERDRFYASRAGSGRGYGAGYGNAPPPPPPPGAYDDDRFQTNYDASRYYRDDTRYQERALSANDEVYRGSDGRYYCKRNDGTTGLILGGVGGAGIGNLIDGGRRRGAGTLIGGALGALIGKSVEQQNSDVRCR
jgi:hypothetical protein